MFYSNDSILHLTIFSCKKTDWIYWAEKDDLVLVVGIGTLFLSDMHVFSQNSANIIQPRPGIKKKKSN